MKTGDKKYIKAKAAALEIRTGNDLISAPQILEDLRRRGISPLPHSTTIGNWCRKAGMPILLNNQRPQYSKATKDRIATLRRQGMSYVEVQSMIFREIQPCPSSEWIRRHYHGWNIKTKRPRKLDPWRDVRELGVDDPISMNYYEAFDILDRGGVDHQRATAGIMAYFAGLDFNAGYNNCPMKAEEPEHEIKWRVAA